MIIKRQIIATVVLAAALFFIFEYTNLDVSVQDLFFDTSANRWLLLHVKHSWMDIIFYSGIKKVIVLFGLTILFLYIYSFKKTELKPYRKGLLIVWLSMMIVPLAMGSLKALTNTPCPCHSQHYGGAYPYLKVLDEIPATITKKFKCFPAGHASGGFALMSLFFLFKRTKHRFIALGSALFLGWSMGLYKMLIGDHYLSHTVITMLLAWLMILILYSIIENYDNNRINALK